MIPAVHTSPPRIFLSYRRDDTRHLAGRLNDRLVAHFGQQHVFTDVNSIGPGLDFTQEIANAVGACDVLLVLIGAKWTTLTDEGGLRRIDDPQDWVALEVRAALERNIRVVPVLVDGAALPGHDELPVALRGLATRQTSRIDYETFGADVDALLLELGVTPRSYVPPVRRVRPLRTLAVALTVALGLYALLAVLVGVVNLAWPASASPTEYTLADSSRERLGIALAVVTPCTVVLFLVLLYRARVNSEALAPIARQRHSRVMVFFCWVVPVVQFWWPKQFVDDVWRASRPDVPRDVVDLRPYSKSRLVFAWWCAFAAFWAIWWAIVALSALEPLINVALDAGTSEHPLTPIVDLVLLLDVSLVSTVAAVLAIPMVNRLAAMQTSRT